MNSIYKSCSKCNKSYPRTTEYFGKDKNRPDGFFCYCKSCKSTMDKFYRLTPVGRKTIEQRFWDRVDKKSDSECWEWTGTLIRSGYGSFSINVKLWRSAHRFSYELHNGAIPEGTCLLHTCDNKKCVNPRHLKPGTHTENMKDMVKKGRQARGIGHGNSKLTADDIQKIRKMHGKGVSRKKLAGMFKTHLSNIHFIVNRISWRHID